MNLLEKNLAVLRERQPDLAGGLAGLSRSPEVERLESPGGLPVHRCRGTLLHSRLDPVREAVRWAEKWEAPPKVVVGFSGGYHLEALLERGAAPDLTVVEPDGPLLRTVLEDRDLTPLLKRIHLVVEPVPARAAERLPDRETPWCAHPPLGQIRNRYLESLQALWAYRIHQAQPLRIQVVGPVYGGSLPIADYVREALAGLGHTVSYLDMSVFAQGFHALVPWDKGVGLLIAFEQVLSRLIEERVRDFSPDLVLCLAQAPVRAETLDRLRGQGIRLAYWFVEDLRRMDYWSRLAPRTDAFFVIQREGQDRIRAAGAPCVRYLPTAALPSLHAPGALTPEERARFGSPVSFVGAGYPNRRRCLARLPDVGLKIWGNEWAAAPPVLEPRIQEEGRRVSPEETVKIFHATRVNLNLHSSTYHEEVDPHGDFINPRTFELAACRAFQLVDHRTLLEELFTGEEVAVFKDLKELKEKIPYYLDREEERARLAQRAYRRALDEHTYALRMMEMLGTLYEQGLRPRPEARTASELFRASDLPEMRAFLARFPEGRKMALAEMDEEVRKKGTLTREDRMFLTLMAFR